MASFELVPNEEELLKFEAQCNERDGYLHITTERLVWVHVPKSSSGPVSTFTSLLVGGGSGGGSGGGRRGERGGKGDKSGSGGSSLSDTESNSHLAGGGGGGANSKFQVTKIVVPWSIFHSQAVTPDKPRLKVIYTDEAALKQQEQDKAKPPPSSSSSSSSSSLSSSSHPASSSSASPVIFGSKSSTGKSWLAAPLPSFASKFASASSLSSSSSSSSPVASQAPSPASSSSPASSASLPTKSNIFTFTSSNALEERNAAKDVIQRLHTIYKKKHAATASPDGSDAASARLGAGTPVGSSVSSRAASPSFVSRGASPVNLPGSPSSAALPDAATRAKLLASDRKLEQLYDDLVRTSKALTEEEFWQSRQNQLATQSSKSDKESGSGPAAGASSDAALQQVGVPSAFLADMRQEAETGNDGVKKFVLTPVIIANIFRTYPKVRDAYQANVPLKLTEKEFWMRFLRSHYFHRDRQSTHQSKDPEIVKAEEVFGKDPLAVKGITSIPAQLNNHSSLVLSTNLTKAAIDASTVDKFDELADLTPEPQPEVIPLKIAEKSVFSKQSLSQSTAVATDPFGIDAGHRELSEALFAWEPRPDQIHISAKPLKENTAHALIVASSASGGHAPSVLDNEKESVRREYNAVEELVRHMWSLFPITSAQQEDKAKRIASALSDWSNKLTQARMSSSAAGAEMRAPIIAMIAAALDKFAQRKPVPAAQLQKSTSSTASSGSASQGLSRSGSGVGLDGLASVGRSSTPVMMLQ